MSTDIIDLNNLAAIIRKLKEAVSKLTPEELETLEVLLDDDAMAVLNLPPSELEFQDFDDVRVKLEDPDK